MQRLHAPVYDARRRALVNAILPHLRPGDRLLDVGCGNGTLAHAIATAPDAPEGIHAEGLESHPRGGEPIPVTAYDAERFPFDDDTFDAVLVADVLHHDRDPERVLRECARVTRRALIVKDHQIAGPLAQPRIALIDWAANAPYGVPCLFRYNTPDEWDRVPDRLGMTVDARPPGMDLYPPVLNLLFGRRLQYFAVYRKGGRA